MLLANENAAALGVADRFAAVTPDGVPADEAYDEIWSNPPIRIGKEALHALLLTWLPRLAPGGRAVLVVGKNLGADSLQRWLGEQGWPDRAAGQRQGLPGAGGPSGVSPRRRRSRRRGRDGRVARAVLRPRRRGRGRGADRGAARGPDTSAAWPVRAAVRRDLAQLGLGGALRQRRGRPHRGAAVVWSMFLVAVMAASAPAHFERRANLFAGAFLLVRATAARGSMAPAGSCRAGRCCSSAAWPRRGSSRCGCRCPGSTCCGRWRSLVDLPFVLLRREQRPRSSG